MKQMKSTAEKIFFITFCLMLTLAAAACASATNSAQEHLKQGDAFLQQGKYDEAIAEYAAAGQADPGVDAASKISRAQDQRMASLLSAGDLDIAVDEAKADVAKSSDEAARQRLADAYIERAWFYKAKRLNPYTLQDLSAAVQTAPGYYLSHYELGRFYNNQWQYSLAIPELSKALSLKDDFAPAYSERAFSYYKNQKLDLAQADADKSIELDAAQPQYYYVRSLIYRTLGKNDLAGSDLKKVLELSVDSSLTDKAKADLQLIQTVQP